MERRTANHLEHAHTGETIRERFSAGPGHSYLRDFVYGGIDGAVTTFAIVSGVIGAELSPRVVLILGVANLIADGFSMSAANYLATRAEHEEVDHAAAVERRHIATTPEGERAEVREIFRRRGLEGDLLERVTQAITAEPDRWVRTMLRDEYGLPASIRSPWRAAASTFLAFVLCGLVPVVPFALKLGDAFLVAISATAAVFVAIGALKSRWSLRPWWRSAVETLAVGGGAAAVAYAIGAWLKTLVS